MAREAVWFTQRSLTGTTTSLPRWVRLLPDDAPVGATVIRTIVMVQVSATHDSPTEPARPILINGGVIFGPEPVGTEMDTDRVNSVDWMWAGTQTTDGGTLNAGTIYWLDAGGAVSAIDTRARRRLSTGSSVWFLLTAQLTAARTFNASQIFSRTLYLLPE